MEQHHSAPSFLRVGVGAALVSAPGARADDLNKPQLSKADVEREAELTKLNGNLYTVAKAQFVRSLQ